MYTIIETLNLIALTLHLAAMNFLTGGAVVVLTGKFPDRWRNPAVRQIVKLFPAALAATVTFGLAPLIYTEMVTAFSSPASGATGHVFWTVITVATLISYGLIHRASFGKTESSKGALIGVALGVFVIISLLFSSTITLVEQPALFEKHLADGSGSLMLNTDVGSWLYRWMHIFLATITVGAFFTGIVTRHNETGYNVSKVFFLYGMIATIIFGLIYLMSMGELIGPLMRTSGAWWLTLSLVLSLGSLHFYFKRKWAAASGCLLISLLGMVALRDVVKKLHLTGGEISSVETGNLETAPVIIFVVLLIAAFAVSWMLLRKHICVEQDS